MATVSRLSMWRTAGYSSVIVAQTARSDVAAPEMRQAIEGRLLALSGALLGILISLVSFVLFYLMSVFTLSWGTSQLGYTREQFDSDSDVVIGAIEDVAAKLEQARMAATARSGSRSAAGRR